LFFDETAETFDFHPIMRAFLYRDLIHSFGNTVHTLAIQYFEAVPAPEKIVTLEDLAPVIELYHHMVKADKLDSAYDLYRNRLVNPLYFQLSAYHLIIELLRHLFPGGDTDTGLPRLKKENDQAWTLNDLANCYSLSGQPANAMPLILFHNKLQENKKDKKNLAIGLGNLASDKFRIGHLSTSSSHLRKSINLHRELGDEFRGAVSHQELGGVLSFVGQDKVAAAEEELSKSITYNERTNDYQGLGIDYTYRSQSSLLQSSLAEILPGQKKQAIIQSQKALNMALLALKFIEKNAIANYPTPREFVQTYWLMAEALVQCRVVESAIQKSEISFYDEHFQERIRIEPITESNLLSIAETCLNEALRRCRKVNLVVDEPYILLALARLDRAKGLPPAITILEEAHTIAQRAGYRIKLADLHLLCGQILLDNNAYTHLLGLTAKQHLQKTQEYALDMSTFEDLYQSPDPDFYKGIPEYDMLKRGMTDQERIDNGYWIAYRIAEALLKNI
jgi:hypothetical protein